MTTQLTIGAAARAAGVTPRAVRLYEKQGLLPETMRTGIGYRLFTDSDVDRLRFIRRSRDLGLRLADIAEILTIESVDTPPCSTVTSMIDERIADIDARLSELGQLRDTLEAVRHRAIRADSTKICPIIEADEEPEGLIVSDPGR